MFVYSLVRNDKRHKKNQPLPSPRRDIAHNISGQSFLLRLLEITHSSYVRKQRETFLLQQPVWQDVKVQQHVTDCPKSPPVFTELS